MAFRHAHVVPILLGVWFPLTFVLTYLVAVYNENVLPVFPYISDTGTWSPESCIFDILLTIGSIFMVFFVYVRYRQVRELCEKNDFKPIATSLNNSGLYLGVIAAFGVVVVGCFQETNLLVVHLIGAFMCFGLGTVYQLEQVVISFLIYPTLGSKCVNIFRATCVAVIAIAFGMTSLFGVLAYMQFTGNDITKWKEEDGGHTFHLVSVFSEWVLAILTQFFLASFYGEFKLVQFSEPPMSSNIP